MAGVLASFLLIAVVACWSLRMGGAAVGWGMQFQSPAFVLFLMALFLALGLNMSGVFTSAAGLRARAMSLRAGPGLSGYFFTGVLATLVATPCTAPFMGAAIGYAFSQPAAYIFAVLLALGLGFACRSCCSVLRPRLAAGCLSPARGWRRFKQLMAFPLYATVAGCFGC